MSLHTNFGGSTGCFKKNLYTLGETKSLGTSYSETTYQLDLKLWQQGVLMRTPCCQSLRSNRLVVSEYEVPKVWFPKSVKFFLKHPVGPKLWSVTLKLCQRANLIFHFGFDRTINRKMLCQKMPFKADSVIY